VQAVFNSDDCSKSMIKFLTKYVESLLFQPMPLLLCRSHPLPFSCHSSPIRINPESIIDVRGVLHTSPAPVESCSQQDVEVKGVTVSAEWP
jgi:hypothetical protein